MGFIYIMSIPEQFMHPVIMPQYRARLVLMMESILRLCILPVLCGLGRVGNVKGLPSGTLGRYLPRRALMTWWSEWRAEPQAKPERLRHRGSNRPKP